MISLMQHQSEGVEFFRHNNGRALFYWDPGTGKTFAAAEIIKRMNETRASPPILIICPASLIKQWEVELDKYLGKKKWDNVTIVNYEKFALKKYAGTFRKDYYLIIADECQKMLNPAAKSTRAIKKIVAPYLLAMSGTPCPNALWELWSVIDWLSPGILGPSYYRFKEDCCKLNFFGGIEKIANEEWFRKTTAPLINRVHKEDVLHDLPSLNSRTERVVLSDELRARYNETELTFQLKVDEDKTITITNALAMISYLRQIVDSPHGVGITDVDAPKINAVTAIMENKAPTLIFTEHTSSAYIVTEELKRRGYKADYITGITTMPRRHELVGRFQAGELDVLVGTSALQTGLNLQRATRVIHYSYPWNPARLDQRVSRAWRKGQTKPVEEISLLATGTIDEKIARLIERKRLMEGKLSKREILSLLK